MNFNIHILLVCIQKAHFSLPNGYTVCSRKDISHLEANIKIILTHFSYEKQNDYKKQAY